MIGSSGTLVDKKGGFVIPHITKTATTKTYEMTLPYGASVVAQNIVFEEKPNATISESGFICNKQEYTEVVFTVPINTAVSVYNNKSILYVDSETLNNDTIYHLFKNMKINDTLVSSSGKVVHNTLPVFISY